MSGFTRKGSRGVVKVGAAVDAVIGASACKQLKAAFKIGALLLSLILLKTEKHSLND